MTAPEHSASGADVLVVGGGPAGCAVAIPLARSGAKVVVVERSPATRPYGFANLISPRSIDALDELGVLDDVVLHRIDGLRLTAGEHSTSIGWPERVDEPGESAHAATVRRHEFDGALLAAADRLGATTLTEHEAIAPIVDRGFVRGARIVDPHGDEFELRADFTVVADGADSRFGRAIGTSREQTWPWAVAQSATFASALHTATEVELVFDLRDRAGTPITGAGWMFPAGDGTVGVGVSLFSTSPSFQVINPAHLLDRFVEERRAAWLLDGGPTEIPATGRIPLGLSVGPSAGPTYLLVGDAVGSANPLSGGGVDTALESGLIAADVLGEAIASDTAYDLQRYPQLLNDEFGRYYRVGRLADRLLGHPSVSTRLGRLAAGNRRIAEPLARLVTRELRPGRFGGAELIYRLAHAASVLAPNQ